MNPGPFAATDCARRVRPLALALLLFTADPGPRLWAAEPAAPPAAPATIEVPGAGGVRVGTQLVSARDIWDEYYAQHALSTMMHGSKQAGVDTVLLAAVVSQVVGRVLLDQEARRLGYAVSPAEESALRDAERSRWRGGENYQTALRMLSVTEEHQLAKARSAALRAKLAAGESGRSGPPTAQEERAFYDGNPKLFLSRENPPLRYVFVPRAAGVNLQVAFREVLQDVDAARREHTSFAALVARHSRHPGAAAGGIVDEGGPGKLPFQPAGLKPCRSSSFAADDAGLHVYARDCVLPQPFEEIRDRVRELAVKDRDDRFLSALLERLRAETRLEYLPLEGEVPPPRTSSAGHGR